MEYILCSIFLIMSSSISSLIILMNMKKSILRRFQNGTYSLFD